MSKKNIKVTSEAELSAAIAQAEGPLAVQGAGTRGVRAEGQVLSVAGLSGITLYEPGALTMVAQAGTPIAEIEKELAKNNQRLAFEPMDHRGMIGSTGKPTIGGVFAANVSGPRRISVGAARDFLLGVRFVDGRGEIVKNGGRVMKNVTGYDLVKLMSGSFGTLGVLSEVSFKVLPCPETEGTLMLHGLDLADAVSAMSSALGTPWEITGAAHFPMSAGDDPVTMLRIEGFEDSVAYRINAVRDRLGNVAEMSVVNGPESAKAWQGVRDVTMSADTHGDIWKISCKPSDAPGVIDRAAAEWVQMDWGGGLIWMRMAPGSDLRARLGDFDGHATLVRADDATTTKLGMFHPEAPGVAKLSAGLRARFDPKGILNAGLMEAAG